MNGLKTTNINEESIKTFPNFHSWHELVSVYKAGVLILLYIGPVY